MIAWLRVNVSRLVMRASARGNPLARRLNARATQGFISGLPPESAIVPGPFEVPDLSRPLPEGARRSLGDYELVPLDPVPVREAELKGRPLDEIRLRTGGFGMGGFGFVGLRMGEQWLIVPLFEAAQWMALDGRLLEDPGHAEAGRPAPWVAGDPEGQAVADRLVGQRIKAARLRRDAMRLDFDNGAVLAIDPDPARRPRMEHGGHARAFLPQDDLSAALFFSPSPNLYG